MRAAKRSLRLGSVFGLWVGFAFGALVAICAAADDATEGSGSRYERLTSDGYFKQRPAWSHDGRRLVFARHEGNDIFLYVLEDGVERRLTENTAPEFDAVWHPDGRRLAFAFDKASPNQGDIDVYAVSADGKEATPLAATEEKLSHEESPAWSPDGKQLAYTSTRDGNQELYICRADGSEKRRMTSDPAIDAHPAWSPDGKRIALATNRWGDLEIATVAVESGEVTRLTESAGLDDYPAWSPDGEKLAFTSNRDGNLDVFVLDLTDGSVLNATDHPAIDNFPAWTPDGRLTFVSNRDGGFEIYVERERDPK